MNEITLSRDQFSLLYETIIGARGQVAFGYPPESITADLDHALRILDDAQREPECYVCHQPTEAPGVCGLCQDDDRYGIGAHLRREFGGVG